jgi:hypothetical protein
MKSTFLLLGAAALAAMTLNAADYTITRSPRAADSQIRRVAGTDTAVVLVKAGQTALQSPRAASNQIKIAAGVANETNPALACRSMMTGSPKAVGACADNPAMPACNGMTVAQSK